MLQALLSGLRNFPMGAFLGALIGIFFMRIIESELSDVYTKYATFGISALVALLGSGLAVAGVLANIENQNEKTTNERNASLAASKALLPLALSRLHEVASNGTSIALEDEEFFDSTSNHEDAKSRLEIGDNTIGVLKESLEYSDSVTQLWIALIFAHYQVNRSRTLAAVADAHLVITDNMRGELAYGWETMRAMVSHLFDYARGACDSPPRTLDVKTIKMSLGHPKMGTKRFNDAAKHIAAKTAKLKNGDVETFRLDKR